MFFQLIFWFFAATASGQTPDSTLIFKASHPNLLCEKQDTATQSLNHSIAKSPNPGWLKTFFTKNYPSPKKAVLLSLVLPGAGQIYNHSWWKVPIVYGGLGGMIWLINHNSTIYDARKTAYYNKQNNLPVEAPYTNYDAYTLKFLRDDARSNLELSGIATGLVYLFITADAFVTAHLKKFDVSDDLSLKITPG